MTSRPVREPISHRDGERRIGGRISRRSVLAAFLSLAAYLRLVRPVQAADAADANATVLAGRWLLKRGEAK